jgi:phage shock protein A
MATLLTADAHGVVDALEDKALTLRQHVREAGAELARKKSRLEAFAAEAKDLEDEAAAVAKEKARLEADVELALAEDQEDLARFTLRKLLPLGRRTEALERRREALRREHAELAAEIDRQQPELERLEAQARAYLHRVGHPEGTREGAFGPGWWEPVADEEVEIELLRRRKEAAGKGGT